MSASRQRNRKPKKRHRQSCCQRIFASIPIQAAASLISGCAGAATTYWAGTLIPGADSKSWFPPVQYAFTTFTFFISAGLTAYGIGSGITLRDQVLEKTNDHEKQLDNLFEYTKKDQDDIDFLLQRTAKHRANFITLRDAMVKTMKTVAVLRNILEPGPQSTKKDIAKDFEDECDTKRKDAFQEAMAEINDIERQLPAPVAPKRARSDTFFQGPGDTKSDIFKTPVKKKDILKHWGLIDEEKKRASLSDLKEPLLASDSKTDARPAPVAKKPAVRDEFDLDDDGLGDPVSQIPVTINHGPGAGSVSALQQNSTFRPQDHAGHAKERDVLKSGRIKGVLRKN